MQYGQSGKKINKQEYYCTRCKRKLPYKICPLHGMEPVIMLDAASQPSGMGTSGSNGSASHKGGKSPRPLPSGTGFEQPVKQPPVTTPPPAARPAPPAPQPQQTAARPAPPARPAQPRPTPTPAPPARPAATPVAARPAAPPARPAPPRQQPAAPPARPQARAATIAPPRPAQPAPPRPAPPARPAPPRQQPPVQQTMQQPVAPVRPAPPKPQPPKPQPQQHKPPNAQTSNDGSLFFEMEESGANLFEFDDSPASSLENLIEQNLHTPKPPRKPLEESTQESTAMDMGFDNESFSFDQPSTGFQQEGTSHSFDPIAADPGIHRPAGSSGYHDPEAMMDTNRAPARDASPSRANVKRPKKRRSQAKARRTGLPISAKLALITLIPTFLVAAAVYLSFDKISDMSDSLMAKINGQQTQQNANIPPVIPQEVTEEPRNVAVSQTEETPIEETTALSSGGSLSDRDSIEDLMVSAHQSFDKQQYLRPVDNNAILYLSKVLQLQEDHRPAIEMKSKIIEYYNDKAAIAIESSKYDLAIKNYQNILQITPDDAITKRLLGQAQNLKRSSRKLQNMKALQKTQDEVKRLQKEKYKLKTQVKAERRKLEQINQAGGN